MSSRDERPPDRVLVPLCSANGIATNAPAQWGIDTQLSIAAGASQNPHTPAKNPKTPLADGLAFGKISMLAVTDSVRLKPRPAVQFVGKAVQDPTGRAALRGGLREQACGLVCARS